MAVELLQRVGLSKYEAEAYVALLAHGPLTGYELGKRSAVPLSKSYEVLERLARRGLAFVQPGEPARYLADRAGHFLELIRADQAAVLAALTDALADAQPAEPGDEFWVVRGRAHVLAQVEALLAESQAEVAIAAHLADDASASIDNALVAALDRATARGVRVSRQALPTSPAQPTTTASPDLLVLLVDDRRALVGTLSPATRCQAVVSANPALVLATRSVLAAHAALAPSAPADRSRVAAAADTRTLSTREQQLDWLAWEDRKHQHLWRSLRGGRVA